MKSMQKPMGNGSGILSTDFTFFSFLFFYIHIQKRYMKKEH